jgi:chemotaxis protein methyltransferase WspC
MLNTDVALSIHRATGLEVAPATVERAIKQRMKDCAITHPDAYLDRLNQDRDEFPALIELVVVPETWFFRDGAAFSTAVQLVRDRLDRGKGPVSILSAPCATGEEPYSLAMALLDAGIAGSGFSIEAIDISQRAIQTATDGTFGRNAFRTQDLGFRDRHFARADQTYVLNRQVRECVSFSQGNLMTLDTAARAHSYDIIFCRNLLIYFNDGKQQEAAGRLAAMLRNDGMLFAGYAEVPVFHHHGFVSAPYPKAFCLQKAPASQASIPAVAPIRLPSAPAVTLRQDLSQRAGKAKRPSIKLPRPCAQPGSKAVSPNAEAMLAEARALADQGEFKSASIRLAECLRHRPDFAEANLLLGLISERNGDLRAAEDYIRRAVYFDPQHYEAVCHLAILAEKRGNVAGAEAARQRAARVLQRQEGRKDKAQ